MDTFISILIKYGIFGVAAAAFSEAVFFPPPVEIILLPVMLSNPNKAVWYGIATVFFSILGSTTGYCLARKAGPKLLYRFFSEDKVRSVELIYNKYGVPAVITSAFTPIPYEIYTLSAGAFKMDFLKFIIAVLIGRILRYIPEGIAVQMLGYAIDETIFTYATWITTLFIVIILVYIIIKRHMKKDSEDG